MAELLVSRRAEDDLLRIWLYMSADNSTAADRLLQMLRTFPAIGPQRDDIRPGLRMLVEGNYLLLYEHEPALDRVVLVAVVDGRRNVSGFF